MTHQSRYYPRTAAALLAAFGLLCSHAVAQQKPKDGNVSAQPSKPGSTPSASDVTQSTSTADDSSEIPNEDTIVLSPFEVSASKDTGYMGSTTLAGSRLNTDIRDLGTSVSVYSSTFLKDIGAYDNQTLLQYTLGSEVGGINGNFAGAGGGADLDATKSFQASANTRIRGLTSADETRDLFLTSIPWDGYNVDGVDLQRGPNSILFGQGSPAGIINTRLKQAEFRNHAEVSSRFDQWGSARETLDVNRVLLKGELALRFDWANNHTKFEQKQAFDNLNREYMALRWEPAFLKKAGARTIIKLNGEYGEGKSNRPRNLPPVDRITPWFTALNKQLYNPAWVNDNQTFPGYGEHVTGNANYTPWMNSNFGGIYFGGPIYFFNGNSSTSILNQAINPYQTLGLRSDGTVDKNITGVGNLQPYAISTYQDYARLTNQPFYTLAKNKMVTDPNIFDFYSNLLEGPNKSEWQHFYNYNISLTQTFFNDSLGFDVVHNREHYVGGGKAPFAGGNLFVDFYSSWGDGTNEPGHYLDNGTVNQGAGRPYIYGTDGGSESTTDRENTRITAFATHDFSRGHQNSLVLRALGTQTVTGLWTHDTRDDYTQQWIGAALAGNYINQAMFDSIKASNGRFWADFVPHETIYLGPSLTNATLAGGLHIPSATALAQPASGTLRFFNPTWKPSTDPSSASYVDPNAVWYNQSSTNPADGTGATASTQSENPANYVGWTSMNATVIRDDTTQNRNDLSTKRIWNNQRNDAKAIVWQGKFWDGSVVGTAGWRRDTVSGNSSTWTRDGTTPYDWDPLSPTLWTSTNTDKISRTSKSWSIVAHLNDLPFISRFAKSLPLNVSLTYNRSENFQTGTLARSYFNDPLPLPDGHTKDIGILLDTKDQRFSLRINKFESVVKGALSDAGIQYWNYGNNIAIMEGFVYMYATNTTSSFAPDGINRGSGIISNNNATADINNPNDPVWAYDYQPKAGQTLAQANAEETADVNAWLDWEKSPAGQAFAKAWGVTYSLATGYDPNAKPNYWPTGVSNMAFTEDDVSKGYEVELNAQITHNWRVTVNASKIKAIRNNIGGEPTPFGGTVMQFLQDFDNRMRNSPMGDTRMWGASANASTDRDNWLSYADGDMNARLAQQGTNTPENRIWHVNVITNYSFSEGFLKGFNIGGAMRYQSGDVMAYKPIQNSNYISYDLNTPYRGPAETDFDAWIGYTHKLFNDKVTWNVQLNASNLFVGNELVPVTVQGDGSPAGFRIRPHQAFSLTNSFQF